jgi:hypothetical protein
MFDINLGMVELFMFGAFILGSYIKNKLDNRVKTKNIQELFQCSVHLGIALYTIYNINNNNAFNSNLIQETNKMLSHYGKNFGEMVSQVKVKLDEYSDKNEKIVEFYNKVVNDVKNTMSNKNETNENENPSNELDSVYGNVPPQTTRYH